MNQVKDILIFGCSHIFGTDLDDCNGHEASNLTWPNFIFPNKISNFAKPAGSCKTVARRLNLILTMHIPKLVIIQWPDLRRWEIIDKDFEFCGKDFPYQTNKELEPHPYNARAKAKFKLLTLALDDPEIFRSNLETILQVNYLLKAKNIPVVNLYARKFSKDLEYPSQRHSYVRNKTEPSNQWSETYDEIAKNQGYNSFSLKEHNLDVHHGDVYINVLQQYVANLSTLWFENNAWVEWCESKNYNKKSSKAKLKGGGGHFEERAHKDASIILENYLKEYK
jgi:hypothetical protein